MYGRRKPSEVPSKKRKKLRRCRSCKKQFSAKGYPQGGGVYCSPDCKIKAYAAKTPLDLPPAKTKADFSRNYMAYINSGIWQNKRQMALAMAGHRCAQCGKQESGLHVHHLTYERLGHEDLADLKVLCPRCHNEIHKEKNQEKAKQRRNRRTVRKERRRKS